jgi:cytochrome P450
VSSFSKLTQFFQFSLAWLEMRVALAMLIRRFKFEHLPGDDMTPIFDTIIVPIYHYEVDFDR